MNAGDFRFVSYLWDSARTEGLGPIDRLVYRSNLLGSDQRITNTGGGNTSSKSDEPDPLSGQSAHVLWVKGSGGDLRTSKRENFASLYLDRVEALRARYEATAKRGPKSQVEDDLVSTYPHCTFNLNPRAASIDTPLHALVPHRCVDHTHPNAVIAIAAAADGERLTREIYGDAVLWLPWQRPGFDLGVRLAEVCAAHPKGRGVVLGQHGLINWADDDLPCYTLSLELIEKAARFIEQRSKGERTFGGQRVAPLAAEDRRRVLIGILPRLRGALSLDRTLIATVQHDEAMLRFVCSNDAPRLAALGTSCPDHFLRTKIKPLYVDWKPDASRIDELLGKLDEGIEAYREDYAAYYERCRRPDSPAIRNPNPTVVLIPGVGMIAWGNDKSESRVTAEFYNCAVEVMRAAETVSEYVALPEQEAFDIEYWALEEAKLRRMPPAKELAGHVALIVGGGGGIGRAAAERLSREGAHLVIADRNADAAGATHAHLEKRLGKGIGVAGSFPADCGPVLSVELDVADRESTRAAIEHAVLAFGGVDDVVITAGIFPTPGPDGRTADADWDRAFAINVTGPARVADEMRRIWQAQGRSGSLVITTSVNAVVCKKGSLAYDASKCAANHLVRELAIELAPHIRVNGVAPATVIEGSAMFPRERVMASLRKYSIPFEESEETAALTERLAEFYAQRTLLRVPIRPADQAEAIYLLVSPRLSRTTGQTLTVDGGLADAFLR